MSNFLKVTIKTSVGKSISMMLDPGWNIHELKEKLAANLGATCPENIKIIFSGKELKDSIKIEECDLGQHSILHAVKIQHVEEERYSKGEGSKPLSEIMVDWQLTATEGGTPRTDDNDQQHRKARFYVYCPSPCRKFRKGKLRVRCGSCQSGAFIVERDPQCWEDVLQKNRIIGVCEDPSSQELHRSSSTFAEFFFKCSEHTSQGEDDQAVPLDLIKANVRDVPCLACTEVSDPVLVFPCSKGHVACIDCFRAYCVSRLRERQFYSHPQLGYTLSCPVGCANSFIREVHHFRLLSDEYYALYQRFGAEECVIQAGGVLCPQPGCGMGILAPEECRKIKCSSGCEFVFCRNCRKGYHLGECLPLDAAENNLSQSNIYNVDPLQARQALWDEASRVAIQLTTKPCPNCRTPTERSGGCMHIICTRPQCNFEWCWICQTEWSRDCMGSHWFG